MLSLLCMKSWLRSSRFWRDRQLVFYLRTFEYGVIWDFFNFIGSLTNLHYKFIDLPKFIDFVRLISCNIWKVLLLISSAVPQLFFKLLFISNLFFSSSPPLNISTGYSLNYIVSFSLFSVFFLIRFLNRFVYLQSVKKSHFLLLL